MRAGENARRENSSDAAMSQLHWNEIWIRLIYDLNKWASERETRGVLLLA